MVLVQGIQQSTAERATADVGLEPGVSLKWQPCTAAAGDSRWLLVGRHALDSETLTAMTLGIEGAEVRWVAWCRDGIHAVLLQITGRGEGSRQHISVYHVPSGTETASQACAGEPDLDWKENSDGYVPPGADSVLVPASPCAVNLCRLPGLDRVAQLAGPHEAGVPATLINMGWAAQGSLIAIAWVTSRIELSAAVTVHSGLDGQLLHTLYPELQIPEENMGGFTFLAFGVCPDQPAAAIAWKVDSCSFVLLINLATGTCTALRRPSAHGEGQSYSVFNPEAYDFLWAPHGRHLVVHQTLDMDRDLQDWAVFATASGELCRVPCTSHHFDDPPNWSSDGTLCLFGEAFSISDLSVDPPAELPYFSGSLDEAHNRPRPNRCAFVPGTKDLVSFTGTRRLDQPVDHWVCDASTGRSLRHTIPGLRGGLLDGHEDDMAWHPSLKAAAASICALAECWQTAAVHLIDAKRHERLITWTSNELAAILETPGSLDSSCIAWSPHGQMLAIVNFMGTIIFDFASEPGAQHG